jgi:hypothetical protein
MTKMAYTTVINVQDPPPPPSRFSRFLDKRAAAIISASVFLFFACASPEITTAPSDPSGPSGSGDGGGAELETLSISSSGFSVDVSSYVYPKSFSPERKYYLAPYPRGEAGAVYFNFKVKSGAVLSEVLLDGRPLNAGSGGSYAAPVVSGSLGRSVEIKVGGAASSVSYYIDMEPFSTSQSGMREVPLVKEGEAFTIGAQYVSDAYFAHVEFNGLGRLEKVLFSEVRAAALEGGGVLEVRPEGSVLPSRWAAAEDGSVRVLDGDPEITAVFTGPRYYYDYLYGKDEAEDLASALRGELAARAAALEGQMTELMNLMVSLSDAQEELIEATDLDPIETVYGEDGTYKTEKELNDEYMFLYFKVAGASAYRAVLISELETGPVSYDGASFSLVDGILSVAAEEEGDSLTADPLEKLYGGFNEDDYRTLKAMEEQITLMYDLLHGDYVTAAMLEEALDGYYDKSGTNALLEPVKELITVNAQAIAALQAAFGVGAASTVADRVAALETALARIDGANGELSTIRDNITAVTDRVAALEEDVASLRAELYSYTISRHLRNVTLNFTTRDTLKSSLIEVVNAQFPLMPTSYMHITVASNSCVKPPLSDQWIHYDIIKDSNGFTVSATQENTMNTWKMNSSWTWVKIHSN